MKNKSVSIQNIADELKISISTVSFVLNGKAKEKHISASLTQKVLDYAQLVNYKPNRMAQSLRTGKSNILVFMVEDISNIIYAKVAKFLDDIAYKKGYKVIFCSIGNEQSKALEVIDFYILLQVDGFIIVSSLNLSYEIDDLVKGSNCIVLLKKDLVKNNCNDNMLFNIANNMIGSMLELLNK